MNRNKITPFLLPFLVSTFFIMITIFLFLTWYREKIIKKIFGRDFDFESIIQEGQNTLDQVIDHVTERSLQGLPDGLRKAIKQINLDESTRRSSLIFLMSNIMDKVDEEIREQRQDPSTIQILDSVGYKLSPSLVGRIASMSRSFRPYRYLEGDTLIRKQLSPERGQLLIALHESNLDSVTIERIIEKGVFAHAGLEDANLNAADFRGIENADPGRKARAIGRD